MTFSLTLFAEATSGGVGKRVSRLRIEAKKMWPDQSTYVPASGNAAHSSPASTPQKKGNANKKKHASQNGLENGEPSPIKESKKRARQTSQDDDKDGVTRKSIKAKLGDSPSTAKKEDMKAVKEEFGDESEL